MNSIGPGGATSTLTAPVAAEADRRAAGPAPRRRKSTPIGVRSGILLSYLLLVALALIYIYPFLISVAGSFKTNDDATQNPLSLLPQVWSFAAYERLFVEVPVLRWAGNSAIITLIVTLVRVFFDSLAGYALSGLHFPGRGILFSGFLTILAVSHVVFLIH